MRLEPSNNTAWYRCMYALVAVQAELLVKSNVLSVDEVEYFTPARRPVNEHMLVPDAAALSLAASIVLARPVRANDPHDVSLHHLLERNEAAIAAELALAILVAPGEGQFALGWDIADVDDRTAELLSLIVARDHWKIAHLAANRANVTRHAHYNLACYFAVLAVSADRRSDLREADLALALRHFRIAAEAQDEKWVKRARVDVCLAPLRRHREGPFHQVLNEVLQADKTFHPDKDTSTN